MPRAPSRRNTMRRSSSWEGLSVESTPIEPTEAILSIVAGGDEAGRPFATAMASMASPRRAEHEEGWAQLFVDDVFVDVVRVLEIDQGTGHDLIRVARFRMPGLHLDGELHTACVKFVTAVSRIVPRGTAEGLQLRMLRQLLWLLSRLRVRPSRRGRAGQQRDLSRELGVRMWRHRLQPVLRAVQSRAEAEVPLRRSRRVPRRRHRADASVIVISLLLCVCVVTAVVELVVAPVGGASPAGADALRHAKSITESPTSARRIVPAYRVPVVDIMHLMRNSKGPRAGKNRPPRASRGRSPSLAKV